MSVLPNGPQDAQRNSYPSPHEVLACSALLADRLSHVQVPRSRLEACDELRKFEQLRLALLEELVGIGSLTVDRMRQILDDLAARLAIFAPLTSMIVQDRKVLRERFETLIRDAHLLVDRASLLHLEALQNHFYRVAREFENVEATNDLERIQQHLSPSFVTKQRYVNQIHALARSRAIELHRKLCADLQADMADALYQATQLSARLDGPILDSSSLICDEILSYHWTRCRTQKIEGYVPEEGQPDTCLQQLHRCLADAQTEWAQRYKLSIDQWCHQTRQMHLPKEMEDRLELRNQLIPVLTTLQALRNKLAMS